MKVNKLNSYLNQKLNEKKITKIYMVSATCWTFNM